MKDVQAFGRWLPGVLQLIADNTSKPSTDTDTVKFMQGGFEFQSNFSTSSPICGFDFCRRAISSAKSEKI